MATYKGRAVLPGELEGEALVSKQPFNTTASYFTNMFGGNTETAPCTDANNKELFEKDLKAGRDAGLSDALIDRLTLTPERIAATAEGAETVASLPDPLADHVAGWTAPAARSSASLVACPRLPACRR